MVEIGPVIVVFACLLAMVVLSLVGTAGGGVRMEFMWWC